jgi:polar amino acid transport system permease protein
MTYRFDFSFLAEYWHLFLEGAQTTLLISLAATLGGFALGTACAIARTRGPAWSRKAVTVYVEVIRNTPLLVQIFLVFFGLASLGLRVGAGVAAVAALIVNMAAYTSEIVRAGIEGTGKGQLEAASALGLRPWQSMALIVLPPAVERVWPALASQFVLLMLASSITSQISVEELTSIAGRVQSDTFRSFEVFAVVGVIYLALAFLLRGLLWGLGQVLFPWRRAA